MSGQSFQDPLEYFQPQTLFRTSSSTEEDDAIKSAKKAIDTANREALTPETYTKYQNQLKELIDTSPNKVTTASYLLKHISEKGFTKTYLDLRDGCVVVKTGGRGRNKRTRETVGKDSNGSQDGKGNKSVGRSTKFSLAVKSGGICQVTGAPSTQLVSSHILPFSSRKGDNLKTKQYLGLVEALFGPDALRRLLENVLNGDKDGVRNINRLDNGVAMELKPHAMWDAMDFFIEVLWDTYNQSTKEFDAKFHWISPPGYNMINYWKPPYPGTLLYYPLADGDIIPFRHRNSSSSSSSATPSSGSPSPTSAPSPTSPSPTSPSPTSALPPTPPPKTPAAESPLPSAHLLYVREIITRIANAMGAAGYAEYDYWDDDDDNESVLASDPEEEEASDSEEEETGKPSKPKEEMLQVAAWLDEARSSRTDEQRMVTLGKRRRSCLEEMTPSRIVMLRSVPYSSSQAGFCSDSDLLSAGDSRRRSIITL